MSLPSGVDVSGECITAFRKLLFRRATAKPTYVIYRISPDERSIVVDESSPEPDYEVFLQRLTSSREPRYAVYDVKYDLREDGQRATAVFISWMPDSTSTRSRMLYASTKEQLRQALDIRVSIHADELHEIEWKRVLSEASGGRIN
ncbi:hypothetical protein BDV18DRAFT_156231 [Aspergillus unguis]